MKANELMVGDFVLLNGKPIKVSAVHNRKIGYHISKTKMVFVFENAIQPIRITQELLLEDLCVQLKEYMKESEQ